MIEVGYEPHSGVYNIEINEHNTLYFSGKKNEDLSGWTIANSHDGCPIYECRTWENSDDEEILHDIYSLFFYLKDFINDYEKVDEIIQKVKEICLGKFLQVKGSII